MFSYWLFRFTNRSQHPNPSTWAMSATIIVFYFIWMCKWKQYMFLGISTTLVCMLPLLIVHYRSLHQPIRLWKRSIKLRGCGCCLHYHSRPLWNSHFFRKNWEWGCISQLLQTFVLRKCCERCAQVHFKIMRKVCTSRRAYTASKLRVSRWKRSRFPGPSEAAWVMQ